MGEHLWYSQVVESIFIKGLGQRLTPDVKKTIRTEGIDLDRLLPGYPVAQVVRALRRVLPSLYPGVDEVEALRSIGASSMQGYNETFIGRAAVQVLKLVGVRRALQKLQTSMRSGNNYLETRFTQVGPTSAELHFSEMSGIPSFYRGLLEEGGRMVGAKHMRVSDGEARDNGWVFRVDWQE